MITAVVLTYNEESRIQNCLTGLKWCDEIIIVDMSSDDNTVELSKSFGAKAYVVKKEENFDLLRNIGVKNASNPWILMIDADEIIPFKLSSWILNEIVDTKYNVFKVSRINYILGEPMRGNGVWPDYQIKLFKKGALEIEGTVHNFIQLNENSVVYNIPNSQPDMCMHHFTTNSLDNFLIKMIKYTHVQAKDLTHRQNPLFVFLKEFIFRYFRTKGFLDKNGFSYSVLLSMYKCTIALRTIHNKEYDYKKEIKKLLDTHE